MSIGDYSCCDLFDYWYSCRNGNLSECSGDRSTYLGAGFIHLTGKDKYVIIGEAWAQDSTNSNNLIDLLQSDGILLKSDVDVALKASLYYWINQNSGGHRANYWADQNNYFRVSAVVNLPGAAVNTHIKGYPNRVSLTDIIKKCM